MRDEAHRLALVVDLGGTKTIAAVVSPAGKIISQRRCLTRSDKGARGVLKQLLLLMKDTVLQARLEPSELEGIAIACAGIIDMRKGMVTMSPNIPGFSGIRLRDMVEREFGVRSYVLNDASAAAWGEYCFGAGRGVKNMVYLTVSTGIGGGIITNGQLYLGADGCAGEIGHMIIKKDGPQCKCGSHGCLEALVSGWAVTREAIEHLKRGEESSIIRLARGKIENITAATISLAAKQGDLVAREVIAGAASYLGVGLANLINIFNPELIIIGGGLSRMGNMLLEPARKVAEQAAFTLPSRTVRILRARFITHAGILGAAAYVFSQERRRL